MTATVTMTVTAATPVTARAARTGMSCLPSIIKLNMLISDAAIGTVTPRTTVTATVTTATVARTAPMETTGSVCSL